MDLFFVLSGFLITSILLKAREEAAPAQRLQVIKNFYIRRVLRIFPIYFLLIFMLAYLFNDPFIRGNILYFITYNSNFLIFRANGWTPFAHAWSLAVEEQFYIIWPWLIIYAPKKYLFGIILSALGIGLASSLILYSLYGKFSTVLLLPCITAFAIGALFAYVKLYPRFKPVVFKIFLWLLPVCVFLFFIYQFGHYLILIRAVNAVIAVNLIIFVTRQNYNHLTNWIFNNRFLTYMGKISYGIYLYHFVIPYYSYLSITYLFHRFNLSVPVLKFLTVPASAYVINLGLLFLISGLSYKYIELNFLKLKRYFPYVSFKNRYKTVSIGNK